MGLEDFEGRDITVPDTALMDLVAQTVVRRDDAEPHLPHGPRSFNSDTHQYEARIAATNPSVAVRPANASWSGIATPDEFKLAFFGAMPDDIASANSSVLFDQTLERFAGQAGRSVTGYVPPVERPGHAVLKSDVLSFIIRRLPTVEVQIPDSFLLRRSDDTRGGVVELGRQTPVKIVHYVGNILLPFLYTTEDSGQEIPGTIPLLSLFRSVTTSAVSRTHSPVTVAAHYSGIELHG